MPVFYFRKVQLGLRVSRFRTRKPPSAELLKFALAGKRLYAQCRRQVRYSLSAQAVDATQALNLSAGVSNVKV
jgi:hypothetical protein